LEYEIGRRIALGQFKELNIILKEIDGSVEALSDSFSKLSTEIQINIIHKGVGAITETDFIFIYLRCNHYQMCVRQVMQTTC
jgi:translation initiation factor IF-2